MHPALLIDEILRQIFHFCSVYDPHSLKCAALASKAWKDPALDFVWNRLYSFQPLLLLLPGITISNNEYIYTEHPSTDDLHHFYSYANRVKHISNKQRLIMNPSAIARLHLSYSNGPYLPNLTTVHISIHRTNAFLMPFNFSPNLVRLTIDLGFQRHEGNVTTILCEYFEHVQSNCNGLRHLSLRGLANERLNRIISGMRNLETLSLRLGRTLLLETVVAIQAFPYLMELEMHAGHLNVGICHSTYQYENHRSFPTLRKLTIRAQSSLVTNIMQHVQCNTLCYLHVELEDPSPSNFLWNPIFDLISCKASDTLHHLSLEHHYEVPELPISLPAGAMQNIQGSDPTVTSLRFEGLHALCTLKCLHHFSLDLTLPIVMSDEDVDKVISWWPGIEHFELGPNPQIDDTVSGADDQLISLASLALFSSKCAKLRRLILPMTIGNLPAVYPLSRNPLPSQLRNLTIARLNTSNPSEIGQYLRRLFPVLDCLEGPCDDTQSWIDINHILCM